MMSALTGLEILEGLVSHREPFETDDADEFITEVPDLALPEFERHAVLNEKSALLT